MSTVSIEQLAERINGKIWVKGDVKRIYIDAGHNTKKMTTKTYVFQREDGKFGVSCYIDCPSQPFQWIESQKEEVIESVMVSIERATAQAVYLLKDNAGNICDTDGEPTAINELYFDEIYSKSKMQKYADEINCTVFEMDRIKFDTEVAQLDEIDAAKRAYEKLSQPTPERVLKIKKSEDIKTETPVYGADCRVKHPKFGEGTVKSEGDEMICILFDNAEYGKKDLLKRFIKLEILSHGG